MAGDGNISCLERPSWFVDFRCCLRELSSSSKLFLAFALCQLLRMSRPGGHRFYLISKPSMCWLAGRSLSFKKLPRATRKLLKLVPISVSHRISKLRGRNIRLQYIGFPEQVQREVGSSKNRSRNQHCLSAHQTSMKSAFSGSRGRCSGKGKTLEIDSG